LKKKFTKKKKTSNYGESAKRRMSFTYKKLCGVSITTFMRDKNIADSF